MVRRCRLCAFLALVLFAVPACTEKPAASVVTLVKVTPALQASFGAAVSTVTERVLNVVVTSLAGVTAPTLAPRLARPRPLAAAGGAEPVAVTQTSQLPGGGTIDIAGTLAPSGDGDTGAVDVNLKAEWSSVPAAGEGGPQISSGTETITGTYAWSGMASESGTVTVELALRGNVALDGTVYTFAVDVTNGLRGYVYNGDFAGQPVSGTLAWGTPTPPPSGAISCTGSGSVEECNQDVNGNIMGCATVTYDYCIEFTDAKWTSAGIAGVCGTAPQGRGCNAVGRAGRCSGALNGLAYTYHSYTWADKSPADCAAEGGTWQDN
jgi:hypothetical protein